MKRVMTAVLVVIGLANTLALANTTLVNIDLSGATVGAPIPTAPAGANPVTAYTAFDGYGLPLGTGIVSNVAGIGKAADLTTYSTNDQVGALYLDTSLNIATPKLSLSFDINVLAQAASGYGQTVNSGATPLLFGVRLYSPTTGNWATTFNVSPTSTTGGVLGFRDATSSTLQTFGTYKVGIADHVQIDVDYAAGTANAYLNNSLVYSGYPLRGGVAPNATTSELFMYLNGSAGTSNEVAIGNVTIQSVPLPAAAWGGMILLGGLTAAKGLKRLRRGQA